MLRFTAKGRIQVWDGEVLVSSHVQEREAYERIAGLAPGKYTVTFPVIEVVSSGAFQSVYSTSSESGRVEARGMAVQVVRLLSDTTPPAVPSGFSATASTATTVTLTLTANGESDFSNYVLERSSDNIGWGYLKSFSGTSTTDTVDISGSVYYYRVFALDTRGNRSAYAGVKSAGPYTQLLEWTLNLPDPIPLTQGGSFSFAPYYSDPLSELSTIQAEGSAATESVSVPRALPSGVTIETGPHRLVASAGATIQTVSGYKFRLLASADADWQSRISGAGVVWYHDFSSDEEVNNFRWTSGFGSGNDPNSLGNNANTVRRITTDGITGGALECFYPANQSMNSIHWWRPLSALTSPGNGRGSNDPAANGTLTVRSYNPTSGGSQINSFTGGWWGHASQGSASKDGNELYLQVRVKMDPRRITGGNTANTVGKFVWLTTCSDALDYGEHVTYSYGQPASGWASGQNYWRAYVFTSSSAQPIVSGSDAQPGGVSTPWYYSGGWDTLLYQLRFGQAGVSSGANSTRLIVYAAHEGETSYTEIVNHEYAVSQWRPEGGLQALMLSAYNNNATFPQEFWHRYAQVILSNQFIPCPQA